MLRWMEQTLVVLVEEERWQHGLGLGQFDVHRCWDDVVRAAVVLVLTISVVHGRALGEEEVVVELAVGTLDLLHEEEQVCSLMLAAVVAHEVELKEDDVQVVAQMHS